MHSDDTPTGISRPHTLTAVPEQERVRKPRLQVAARSDRGRVRDNNEDRYLVVRLTRSTTPVLTNIDAAQLDFVPEQVRWGMAVADGMGGHAAGEVASTQALKLALHLSQQGSQWYVDVGEAESKALVKRMEAILESVDRAIAEQSKSERGLAGMGTTFTLACIDGSRLYVYQVGDSRCYLMRHGRLQRLTRDQTLSQELVDAGLLDQDELHTHRMRHVLTQAMGRGGIAVDAQYLALEDGDRLLLASDGLTDGVPDSAIEEILNRCDCEAACSELLARALSAGGRDNITLIVARVEFED
jgi:serine/threonine protein phosphatase PrpC